MPILRHDVIARLLDVTEGRIATGAWIGDRLVGMANACPLQVDLGKCSELAVLVEDAHQGQGIGTRLVHDLIGRAARHGTNEFAVVTLADNHAMMRIVQRLGHDIRMDRDGGAVTLNFSMRAPAHTSHR